MWIVVTLAKSIEAAKKIEAALTAEGILVKLKPLYKNLPMEENYYEVHVLESEAKEASEIIMEKGL